MSGAAWRPEDIAAWRSERAQHFPDVCDIDRPITTQNAIRESVASYDPVAADQPCRVRVLKGEERMLAMREGVQIDARFTIGLEVDVRQGDRIHALGAYWTVAYLAPPSALSLTHRADLKLM